MDHLCNLAQTRALEFITHLYVCSSGRSDDFIPVPAWLIRDEITECPRRTEKVWRPLVDVGLIDAKEWYSYKEHICREYRVRPPIAANLAARGQVGKSNAYDLASGKRKRGQGPKLKTRLSDSNGNRTRGLVGKALDYFRSARQLINIEEAREHVGHLEDLKRDAELEYVSDWGGAGKKAYHAASCRYRNDATALQVILGQNPVQAQDMPDGILEYDAAYQIQTLSGRISFRHGGPQSASRLFKDAAYSGIPGLYNYDIKSCHTEGLHQLAQVAENDGADISINPLEKYLERGGKDAVASNRDLPRELVKRVEHAVKYGGYLPQSMDNAYAVGRQWSRRSRGADRRVEECLPEVAVLARKHVPPEEVNATLSTLYSVFKPIRRMVRQLASYLSGRYWTRRRKRGGDGGWHMYNAAGVAISPDRFEEGHERRSKMMAWYLQGLESAYVHALTTLGADYNYEPIGNEHDGLITIGKIPEVAQAKARKMSGFKTAELEEKWFINSSAPHDAPGSSAERPVLARTG